MIDYSFKAFTLFFVVQVGFAQSKIVSQFDKDTQMFNGTPVEQAKLLLSPVKKYAIIGNKLETLPTELEVILSERPLVEGEKLKNYLSINNINVADIGGNIDEALSKTGKGNFAKYFVIHDTSTPNYNQTEIPDNINSPEWKPNLLSVYKNASKKSAHVFIDRMGNSVTQNTFITPWRATKFELKVIGISSKGLFLHIENIQPRKSDPNKNNDAIAPLLGFSEPQLKRLALIYIVASNRRREWLIPAYHAVLDNGINDGHDDPQNFDLNQWSNILTNLIDEINR